MLGRPRRRGRRRIETSSRKLNYRIDLLPRYVELLNDFVDAGPGFKVFEHGGYGHPGFPKHPGTAQSARHAFDGWTLGPIERRHFLLSFHRPLYTKLR